MGAGGILKFIFRRFFEFLVIAAFVVLIPNLPPQAKFSTPFTVTPSKPLSGKLALNNRLDDVELWHKGEVYGTEAFAVHNGEVYGSLYNGEIVKFIGEKIIPVVKLGKPCKATYEEAICGRPIGLVFGPDGYLYAMDSYYGLFKVNVQTGKKELLIGPDTLIDGKPIKIFNSVAVSKYGDIYWVHSSTEFDLEDGVFSMLADGSGRLIRYDARTKKNTVLIDGLYFGNGVALSENEDFVIAAETTVSRIQRYYLTGPRKDTSDIFIDGLPGNPDNLIPDGKGGFLVPLIVSRDDDHPMIIQSILPYPLIRKFVARLLGITEWVFKKIDELYPNDVTPRLVHNIGHFTSLPTAFFPARVTILRVNQNGEITDSVHTVKGKISGVSESRVVNDSLWLTSPFVDWIGRIPLEKLGWEDLRQDVTTTRAKNEKPERGKTQ